MDQQLHEKGIYEIVCLVDNKKYIGSTTVSFYQRFKKHKQRLRHNYHENQYLQNVWNKYGEDKFLFLIVKKMTDNKIIKIEEQKLLDEIFKNGRNKEKYFNISPLAEGGNRIQSDEIKLKHSQNIKKSYTPELRKLRGEQMKSRDKEKHREAVKKVIETDKWKNNHLAGVRKLAKNEKWLALVRESASKRANPVKSNQGEIFKSVAEAAKAVKTSRSSIRKNIKGIYTHAGGRTWEYIKKQQGDK